MISSSGKASLPILVLHLFLTCYFSPSPLHAQKLEKVLNKLEKAFITGDFRQISKIHGTLSGKVKKTVLSIQDSIGFLYAESRFQRIKGNFRNSEEQAAAYLYKAESKLGENSPVFLECLLKRATVSFEAGDYQPCRKALNRFFEVQRKFASVDSELVFQARLIQTRNAIESGAFGEASSLIEKLLFKAENRLREKKEETDSRGLKKYKRLTFIESERRNHELLLVKVLKARLLRERGEMKEAGEWIKELKNFMKENEILPEDQASIEYQFEAGRYAFASGNKEDAIQHYKEALSWFSRRDYDYTYNTSHEQYLHILENLILTYLLSDDQNRAKDYSREYRDILESHYPETPAFNLRRKFPLEEKWDFRDTERIIELERLLREADGYALPWRYSNRILSYLKEASMSNDSLERAEHFLSRHVKFLKDKLGSNSVFFHEKNCELAEFYTLNTTKAELADPIFRESLHNGLVPQLADFSEIALKAWNREGVFFELTDKFQKSLNDFIRVLNTLERKHGKRSFEAAVQSIRVAGAEIKLGEYKLAEEKYLSALETIEKSGDTPERVDCERLLARLYIITGRYEEADRYLIRSLKTAASKNVKNIFTYNGMDEEILLLLHKNIFLEAQEKAEEIIRLRSARLKTSRHRSLIIPYQVAAEVFSVNGQYSKAENHAIQACEISKAVFGDTSMHYFKSLAILARVHTSYGDYDRAIDLARQAINGISRYFGEGHIEMAQPLTDVAMVLLYKGAPREDVLLYLNRSRSIVENLFGARHPLYAEALQYMAAYFIQIGKFQDALPLLDQAEKIWTDKLGKTNVHVAEILLARAEIDLKFKRIADARNYFKNAAQIYKDEFNDVHPKYVVILPRIAQTYYLENNLEKALDLSRESNKQSLIFVREFFSAMSDREKSRLWAGFQPGFEFFYTLVMKNRIEKPGLLAEMYDIILQTKAILLSSSIGVRERILGSGSGEVKQKYQNWIRKKEQISAAVEMGPVERAQAGIELRKLESEADELEAALGKISEEFKKSRDESRLTWKQIKSALPSASAAVEMVRFRYFDKGFTDSVLYMALIIKEDKEGGPEAVLLPDGRKMETRYIRYYRNSVKMASKDELSYSVFWAPLKAVLKTPKRIFFSPDGVYNELNPEGLLSPSGNYVIDEEKLTLLSTTRDIPETGKVKVRPAGQKNLAVLLGDPEYYPSGTEGEMTIEKLPGTRIEIDKISSVLKANRWDVLQLMDTAASEKMLKSRPNPRILHIATHGFFMENSSRFLESSFSLLSRNRAIDNPLLRSGLYLSSAGKTILQTEGKNQFQLGEGILSAMEAMNLSLSAADLVVLSACETGRGDIQSGEGVYGLQRAFQIAGARGIIMSLFKVSDEATQELMSIFYKNWIERGLSVRDAFHQAKTELKKTRPEPLFWSSFVLVGG